MNRNLHLLKIAIIFLMFAAAALGDERRPARVLPELPDQKIKDLEIYEKAKWAKNFLLTLKHFYGKSIWFGPIFEELKKAVAPPDRSFMNLALAILNILTANFEIDKEMTLQSKIGITGKGTPLLISLAKELGGEEVILPYFSAKARSSGALAKTKTFVLGNLCLTIIRIRCPESHKQNLHER
jgi:hypothetical protein